MGRALDLESEDLVSLLTSCVLLCHIRSQNFSLISKMEIEHLTISPHIVPVLLRVRSAANNRKFKLGQLK